MLINVIQDQQTVNLKTELEILGRDCKSLRQDSFKTATTIPKLCPSRQDEFIQYVEGLFHLLEKMYYPKIRIYISVFLDIFSGETDEMSRTAQTPYFIVLTCWRALSRLIVRNLKPFDGLRKIGGFVIASF